MNLKRQTEAGLNLIELIFLMALATVTFGVAITVGRRFGLGWGLVAAPVSLAAAVGLYSVFYWAVGFLPYPLGKPQRKHQSHKRNESDSDNVA